MSVPPYGSNNICDVRVLEVRDKALHETAFAVVELVVPAERKHVNYALCARHLHSSTAQTLAKRHLA
jgi:hypothetical protein